MRDAVALLLFFSCFFLAAQEKNSLLWEISGNGLEKTSYLYGTMHVSKKIAFRLDDVFYEALDRSEMVALESDPSTWLENDGSNMGYFQGSNFISKGFYTRSFLFRGLRKEELASYLAFEDRILNNILYRTNEYSQNFEEETYLDMFIYQAGSKFGKPIIALEDLEESTALVGRASLNAVKQKPDEWLQKKMRRQDLMFLMQDAYRERNINLLDSIDRAMYTEHYLENMLYIRNRNMAQSLDSIMKKGKVFAGIGAAHLPGSQGVIALLRNKGYTVKPLVSKASAKGLVLKKKFENKRKESQLSKQSPEDNFFSITLPAKLYPVSEYGNTTYISPDLANGSYVMVNRIPTYAFLKKDGISTLEAIDELLFENIPGKILKKTQIKKQGFRGLDIKNQLKNGDHQRYQVFITPLEILVFKMGGEGDHVAIYSDAIFNSLHFEKQNKGTKLSSVFKDFEISMPSLYNFRNRSRAGLRDIEGYDSLSNTYYFLRKATLNDFKFIEEDTFELRQIQKRFLQDLSLEPKNKMFSDSGFQSEAILDSVNQKSLYLKTSFQRGDYYLLGVITKDKKQANAFFNSFRLKNPTYRKEFRKVRDTALFFTTVTNIEPPKFAESSNNYYQGRPKPKPYAAYSKKTIYQNKNNEAITIELSKSHDFLSFPVIDSVWTLRKKQYSKKKFNIVREQKTQQEDYYELQLTLTDTASNRGILIKNVLKGGLLYELKAIIDTVQKPSRFVSEFFDNFKPADTLIGRDLFEDKASDFFKALRANDSIVYKGYRLLRFNETHLDSLTHYITNFDFPADKKHIQAYLIQHLGKIKDPRVIQFFKRYYAQSYDNSYAQAKILQAIADGKDEKSVDLLLQLLKQDLPLVSNSFEIRKIFKPYKDSLGLGKKLFPEILEYSNITEYKSPIFSLLASLKSDGFIKPAHYKKYRKQILNDAKIQLKRYFGRSQRTHGRRTSSKSKNLQNNILRDYAILLYPYIKEKETSEFFNRLSLVKDPGVKTTYIALLAEDERPISSKTLVELAQDLNSRSLLFDKLQKAGKSSLFPSEYSTQKALAETVLFEKKMYNSLRDTIGFVLQRKLELRGKQYVGYYFKLRDKQDYDKNFKMHLIVFEANSSLTTDAFYKSKGLRIEDTDTLEEAIAYATEGFLLKDRKRAEVYRPDRQNAYGYHGY